MPQENLFAHVASRFPGQTENIATESLAYIIGKSKTAKKAFIDYINQTGTSFDNELCFQTQAIGEDNAIPDMVGKDSKGNEILIIESKFWAGLTDNQPITYIERMPKDQKTAIIFLAPKLRFPTLWHELLRRTNEAKLTPKENESNIADLKICKLNDNNIMALASWQSILGYLHRACEADGQTDLVSDIGQLLGLCNSQDQDAFLPLRSEELSSGIGGRIVDYCNLVNSIKDKLLELKIGNIDGLRSSGAFGNYGCYIRIYKYNCFLCFDAICWSNDAETPLWIFFFDGDFKRKKFSNKFLDSFEKLMLKEPNLGFHKKGSLPTIPLFLPPGKEDDEVVNNIIEQIKHIFNDYLL